MLSLSIPGLRNLQGRFASMRSTGLRELQTLHAQELGSELEKLYQERAPHGETGNFSRSIHGNASWTGLGFKVKISTENGDLARWLREGTGIYGPRGQRIRPVNGKALAFNWQGQHWVLASTKDKATQSVGAAGRLGGPIYRPAHRQATRR